MTETDQVRLSGGVYPLAVTSQNDVIVLQAPGHITDDQVKRLESKLAELFPHNKCLVIGDGLCLSVIRQ